MAVNPAIHESQHQCGISPVPQTDYVTATAVATALKGLVPTSRGNYIDYSNAGGNNKGHSNGSDFGTEAWVENHDSAIEQPLRASSQDLGRLLYLKLGSVTTTALSGAQAGLFQHVFKRQNPFTAGRQLPVTTYYEIIGALLRTMPSSTLIALKLMGERNKQVQLQTNFRGSGEVIEGETRSILYTEIKKFLWMHNASLTFAGTAITCDLESIALDLTDAFLEAEGYRTCSRLAVPGDLRSGQYRSEFLVTDANYKFDFVTRAGVGSPVEQYLKSKAKATIALTLQGEDGHSLTAGFKIVVDTVKRSSQNGIVVLSPSAMLYTDLGANVNDPITLTLVNDVASYTA